MENLILEIAKDLLGISMGFTGLLFTSLSILINLKGDKKENWKIITLKKSNEYKKFISLNTYTAIGFIFLFIFSIFFLFLKELAIPSEYLSIILFIYILYLMVLIFNIAIIAYRYKQIIYLTLDNDKPKISE